MMKPRLRKRDHDPLVRDEVFLGEFQGALLDDARAPFVAVFGLEVCGVLLYKSENAPRVGEQVFQVRDSLEHLGVFIENFLSFQVGQAPQLHIQDGLRL